MYKPQTDKWHDRDNNSMDVDTPKRLSEPCTDDWKDGYTTGMADAEKIATQIPTEVTVRYSENPPKSYASGGYTGTGTKFAEPAPGNYTPRSQVELDPVASRILPKPKRYFQ